MAKKWIYLLNDPGYTIYHRAALGGLAATISSWKKSDHFSGIHWNLEPDRIVLSWDLPDTEALPKMLEASFRLTPELLIDLPGHQVPSDKHGLRLAIHNGLCGTFLQHHKMRPAPRGEKGARTLALREDEKELVFSYKPVASYAHQKAQGKSLAKRGRIDQSAIPGALKGISELTASPEEAFLLLFLMVGCAVFTLRPRKRKERAQYCLVIPDVTDLLEFSNRIARLASTNSPDRFTNTYLGRIVGGAEEAALKFLIDLQSQQVASRRAVSGCLSVTMGKVAWDKKQINRSSVARVGGEYPEINVFRAASEMAKSRAIPTKDGQLFAVPGSPLPELIAANLASGDHWASHFREVVANQKDFNALSYLQKGLQRMRDAIEDPTDNLVITAFHEAWRFTMRGIIDDSRHVGASPWRRIEVRRERIRNEILRAKTHQQLMSWFLDFAARATNGNTLPTLRGERGVLREFLFQPRNFNRLQNLFLFGLLSYAKEDTENDTVSEQSKGVA